MTPRLADSRLPTRVVVAEEDILQTRRGKEQVDDVVPAGQESQQRDHAAFERDHDRLPSRSNTSTPGRRSSPGGGSSTKVTSATRR